MPSRIHELAIVGAGPSALMAAVYSAREGVETILFEKSAVGGMAAITDIIENYSGFPEGVTGFELADRMQKQAERFGAVIEHGEVTSIKSDGKYKILDVDGKIVKAKAVIIASGSSFVKMNVPGESEYYGKGVHYCATCDGAFYINKKVIVIGGGNSAVQEAIFLTRFASHVDIVALFDISACGVLKEELDKYIKSKKISVHTFTETKEIISKDNKVIGIKVVKNKKEATMLADGVFVFIGLKPNTNFLEKSKIKLDCRGFIITNDKYETSLSGVFACGDVRSGATMQVACAVGEGAATAINVREYLSEASND